VKEYLILFICAIGVEIIIGFRLTWSIVQNFILKKNEKFHFFQINVINLLEIVEEIKFFLLNFKFFTVSVRSVGIIWLLF
jgi:hypothetical protein